jgi:hypothetical protein
MEDGWQQTLLECLLGWRDTTRAYYQMACELLRSLRYMLANRMTMTSPTAMISEEEERHRSTNRRSNPSRLLASSNNTPPPLVVVVLPLEQQEGVAGTATATDPLHKSHRRRWNPNEPKHIISSPSSTANNNYARSLSPSASTSTTNSSSSNNNKEIEPAFLNEQDYPPGWLIYHPVLGVVAKEEADQYDREQHSHPPTSTTTQLRAPNIIALSPSIAAGGC